MFFKLCRNIKLGILILISSLCLASYSFVVLFVVCNIFLLKYLFYFYKELLSDIKYYTGEIMQQFLIIIISSSWLDKPDGGICVEK